MAVSLPHAADPLLPGLSFLQAFHFHIPQEALQPAAGPQEGQVWQKLFPRQRLPPRRMRGPWQPLQAASTQLLWWHPESRRAPTSCRTLPTSASSWHKRRARVAPLPRILDPLQRKQVAPLSQGSSHGKSQRSAGLTRKVPCHMPPRFAQGNSLGQACRQSF